MLFLSDTESDSLKIIYHYDLDKFVKSHKSPLERGGAVYLPCLRRLLLVRGESKGEGGSIFYKQYTDTIKDGFLYAVYPVEIPYTCVSINNELLEYHMKLISYRYGIKLAYIYVS